jgi:hypothetical protein
MAIVYDVPAGQVAVIDGPAEVTVHGSGSDSRYREYATGSPPPPPVIEYIAPSTAPLPSRTVDVGGTGFSPMAVVVFGGVELATISVSDTLLRATLYADVVGTYDVIVRDGVDSAPMSFEFTPEE